jgi:hypothetical protein
MVMRSIKPHTGKWNASKYKILSTLIWIDKPATCATIAHWSGIPAESVWKDMWRYHQFNYVRQVSDSRLYRYRIAAKGRRFVDLMKVLWLIDTNRFENEPREHRIEIRNKEIEEFKARLSALKKEKREISDT